jgi:ribosomal protein L11 methyltransferase
MSAERSATRYSATIKATLVAAFPEARRISNFLERDYGDAGVAVSLDERADGLWSVDAYFEDGDPDAIAEQLRDRLGADAFGAPLTLETLPETDWVAAGLQALSAVFAGRFVVHGSHDRRRLRAGRAAIEIDAGQAFGTGHHPTTVGCLVVLDRLMRARRFENPLDIGTGSGVLAIALAKILRRRIIASDIHRISVHVAAENAALNGVGPLVRSIEAAGVDHPLIHASAPYDLVVANILAGPLCGLAPRLSPLVKRRGVLVLSGLLNGQRERVVAAYAIQGVRLETAHRFGAWSVLVLRRRG